ncbi:MAG TPA: endonuclease NucS domain-containing protein [Fimbriimonadales bacterium]|nr:endonuclease NucS domain-containing protein [Fimbriimonadales bacterium]
MDKVRLQQLFNSFLNTYDFAKKDAVWAEQRDRFRQFWNDKILSPSSELNDIELDQIIRILDRAGKGNTEISEAIARVGIAIGEWRRMFKEIKKRPEFSKTLNSIFLENDIDKKAEKIDELYKLNEEYKRNGKKHIRSLTGDKGAAICTMLAAFDPFQNLSVVTLKDRESLCNYFGLDKEINFSTDSVGRKITLSNQKLINLFRDYGINYSARTIDRFFYWPEFKTLWKPTELEEDEPLPESFDEQENLAGLFYMERQLEDFLIENWDKTELGKKYELIEENGELVSQQYKTGIGKIDILAKDKKTGELVVIELKRNQSSDDTVGQLTRYMGWIEENKQIATKGVIIAGQFDERLKYALRKLNDVEVYLYEVDFKLKEFKE